VGGFTGPSPSRKSEKQFGSMRAVLQQPIRSSNSTGQGDSSQGDSSVPEFRSFVRVVERGYPLDVLDDGPSAAEDANLNSWYVNLNKLEESEFKEKFQFYRHVDPRGECQRANCS